MLRIAHTTLRRPTRIALFIGALLLPRAAASQQQGAGIRQDALRVFLDCHSRQCDSEYFRTEIGFVNWVRDRTLAQVHLIITTDRTGGGGSVFTLDFVGLQDLEARDDTLSLTTLTTETESEILQRLTRVMAAGLARYSTLIGQVGSFDISASQREVGPTERLVGAGQVEDPWNFWVFEAGADLDLEGEETERRRQIGGSFDARRTTDVWKIELEADADFRRNVQKLDDGEEIVDDRTDWSVGLLTAYALGERWSLGGLAGASASTRRNQEFGWDAAAAVEYSFLPYEQAPRRSLTARYDFGVQYFDWVEETIYFQTAELRPQHELQFQLFQRQPWGETRIALEGRQFLHDLDKWNVSLSTDVEVRIVRGLSLEIRGDLALIEDQLFISAEGLTLEEILQGRFERPTDYSYELSVGLSFEFGSIYNNVVNNRFDRRR